LVGRECIEAGIRQRGKTLGAATLIPEIKELLHQELNGYTNRTSSLLSAIFLEAATTHALILRSAKDDGLSEAAALELDNEAWGIATKKLHNKSDQLKALKEKLRDGLI
jgi:hypothetical protein